jgi:nicotinamidase-related amidase
VALSWRDFQTEQDRAHLEVWGKSEPRGFGSSPAVLVIDVYYWALGVRREPLLESIKSAPGSCGMAGWDAVDRTVELLALARRTDVPVIYAKGMDAPGKWRTDRKGLGRAAPDVIARANDIVDEIAPRPGEVVIQKASPSALYNTPLSTLLAERGIDTVICCGESTSGCVRATVVDANSRGFKVGVVEECTFDRVQMSHHVSLFDMDQKYADVVDLSTVDDYFRRRRRSPQT